MADKVKVKRTRKPSSFVPATRVTVSVHKDAGVDASAAHLAQLLDGVYGTDFAVRTISRSRKSKKSFGGPANLMVYIAPKGYNFATAPAERGVRIGADTANIIRGLAAQMGLDPNDSASIEAVLKTLAAKVTQA
jgi:hypothetical protein